MALLGCNLRVANNRDSGDSSWEAEQHPERLGPCYYLDSLKSTLNFPNWSSRPCQTVPITFIFSLLIIKQDEVKNIIEKCQRHIFARKYFLCIKYLEEKDKTCFIKHKFLMNKTMYSKLIGFVIYKYSDPKQGIK